MSENIVTIDNVDYDLSSLNEEQTVLYDAYQAILPLGVSEYTDAALAYFIETHANN